ncbi:type III-A CRISPR-associated protein Cas10/Csm1 [Actinobacillus equuli]|uniref:type III-A CRISPR-associated protein Cas10/Csm1 n=1 Tax=Actinobacillus equuli TaxID=718 RepID=UPI0024467D48|nr:type III-A CRISPR-associated protein Cas10/Csm1 [Actinobacillus equuli]WGE83008.1 type III-A CRISPR-associated protein Cas10/Csm1 [Actinobacillus equuli subsp. equuli]
MSYPAILAFSVFYHYLNRVIEKHKLTCPNFPIPLHTIDTSLLEQAEKIVLGYKPYTQKNSEKLFSLFEGIMHQANSKKFAYHFSQLTPVSIFPSKGKSERSLEAHLEEFIKQINQLPESHHSNPDLWLDHFDTALQCFTSQIACPYSDEISLYDFSKAVAAFVVALSDQDLDQTQPILLIQGDFFGIQDFIFSGGSESNKQAAKILRGRSFQVSLFTELAALKILQACDLPTTSQMMNAAGKFLIIAPNTQAVKEAIEKTRNEFNNWFIKHTYGLIGLGVAVQPASLTDFQQDNYEKLVKTLFETLEVQKLQRLDLTDNTESVQNVSYPNGVCKMNSYFPTEEGSDYSLVSADQIEIGKMLAKKERIIICNKDTAFYKSDKTVPLKLDIFGYRILFTEEDPDTGEFSKFVKTNQIHRFWDFSLPKNTQSPMWKGYARRYINAYVPREDENENIVTFDQIAEKDRQDDKGQVALMTLKGDVDNLGTIFQKGINPPNIAKMASLSRQMNQFFSLWLPAYCAEHSPNMYTVFAGGDDFFLIGPWHSTQEVAFAMQQNFARYVAQNPEIHFSVGMVMSKVGLPVPRLGDLAEEALEKAKGIDSGKNAVTIYNRTVKWADWHHLCNLEQEIHRLAEEYHISTSYLYSLIRLCELANDSKNIESSMWRSRFYYRTARYVIDKLPKEKRNKALDELTISLGENGISKFKINFAIPLTNYFYQKR